MCSWMSLVVKAMYFCCLGVKIWTNHSPCFFGLPFLDGQIDLTRLQITIDSPKPRLLAPTYSWEKHKTLLKLSFGVHDVTKRNYGRKSVHCGSILWYPKHEKKLTIKHIFQSLLFDRLASSRNHLKLTAFFWRSFSYSHPAFTIPTRQTLWRLP